MKASAFTRIFETLVATVAFHREQEMQQLVDAGAASPDELAAIANYSVNCDTRLDTAAADASLLKPDVAAIVSPILAALQGKHVTLPEFASLLEERLEELSVNGAPLFYLLSQHKTKEEAVAELLEAEQQEVTFKPKLAQKTEKLSKAASGPTRLRELFEDDAKRRATREVQVMEKIRLEMEECTFMPKTNKGTQWLPKYKTCDKSAKPSLGAPGKVIRGGRGGDSTILSGAQLARLGAKLRAASYTNHGSDLKALFKRFDDDHNGKLDIRELCGHLTKLLPGVLSEAEQGQLASVFDQDGDGMVDAAEFAHFCTLGVGAPPSATSTSTPPPPPPSLSL